MSKLREFREAERKLREQMDLLEQLKADTSLKKELEFQEKLETLMKQYGVDVSGVVAILDPSASVSPSRTGRRKPRDLKVYKHPETGEVVETKGGNNRTLKAWKVQYGVDVVKTWLV